MTIAEEDICFHYFYWHTAGWNYRHSWISFLFCCLSNRVLYPKSKIYLFCYTEPDRQLSYFSKILNFNIIYLQKTYLEIHEPAYRYVMDGSRHLLSKPIDSYNYAQKKLNKFVILVDIDFFIFDHLKDLQADKVGVLFYDNNLCSNTGIMTYFTKNKITEMWISLYKSMIAAMNLSDKKLRKKIEFEAYKLNDSGFQEEMVHKLIFIKFQEIVSDIFYDIGIENHSLYQPKVFINYKRTLHLQQFNKHKIKDCLIRTKIFKKFLQLYNNKELYQYLIKYENTKLEEEELNLINCLNSSFEEIEEINLKEHFNIEKPKIFM